MFPKQFQNLIDQFSFLPGIGPKAAQRLAFFILNNKIGANQSLAEAILNLQKTVGYCKICFNFSQKDECEICSDKKREKNLLCVVETPLDILSLENTGKFEGYYFVLGGLLNPLKGLGLENLRFKELESRVKKNGFTEILLALNNSIEGDQTCFYICQIFKKIPIKITRLAQGLPRGGEVGYMDEATLSSAIKERRLVR